MFRLNLIHISFALGLAACSNSDTDVTGVTGLQGSAFDAQQRTIDHGSLLFDTPIQLSLSRSTPLHSFSFSLSAAADVVLRTQATSVGASVDTVLTLYRNGAKHPFARNDDDGALRFSRIERSLPTGHYVVTIEGFKRSIAGDLAFAATCSGTGCPPAAPAPCLFGDTFYALRTEPILTIVEEHWVTALDQLQSALEGQQLVIAVQQSAHTDVTTPTEALGAVDQGEVRRMTLRDEPSGRVYDLFEYGAGDNSYGAIFAENSLEKVVSIHDGDLMECTEHPL